MEFDSNYVIRSNLMSFQLTIDLLTFLSSYFFFNIFLINVIPVFEMKRLNNSLNVLQTVKIGCNIETQFASLNLYFELFRVH